MIEHHIDIATADGAMNTFITHPEEGGPFPVVFFYMDAPGKREELHDMARRLGTAGYYVVLPNLYYRWKREFSLFPAEHGETREEMYGLMNGLSDRMIGPCETCGCDHRRGRLLPSIHAPSGVRRAAGL